MAEPNALARAVAQGARPVSGAEGDYDDLISACSGARVVLLGEASHGTHEFYRERCRITRRLIEECGFSAVAVEADWPDAYRVNCYVRGSSDDRDASAALSGFTRFPAWLWRNHDVLEFVEWLRGHNRATSQQTGFYGLDLYSLHTSMNLVLDYLEKVDPDAARRAHERYACLDRFGHDVQAYGYAASRGMAEPCEPQVLAQLRELLERGASSERASGESSDEQFHAEQNARLVVDAEAYYRTMFRGGAESWNLRDTHMADTLTDLMDHLGSGSRVVVWAHNSHVGDARATEGSALGELSLGQLARDRFGHEVFIVGFTTYTGTVSAASAWGGPVETKVVSPALHGSYEELLHETGRGDFWLMLRDDGPAAVALDPPRLERAIGVIYMPQTECASHYFNAVLVRQFDAVVHLDETTAVRPLDGSNSGDPDEAETFPTGV
ncbi:MAG TPA: erythromycin esterase family protein [Actinomycetota bacterium]|nr:erythromycin esterase family protein [Actinomycetota bacterium]